jgi:hypothetical protein
MVGDILSVSTGGGEPMGAWGGGLYDSDYARDLKGTIKGVPRAPLSDDEILSEIWASHGTRATESDAHDYWLVLADQLERCGMRRPDVFARHSDRGGGRGCRRDDGAGG